MIDMHHRWNTSYKPQVFSFFFSLLLLFVAYALVKGQLLKGGVLIACVVGLALLQTAIQLVLFLHLGIEPKPRWNLMIFWFMLLILVILIAGSMWIMYHLNYNMTMS